MDEPTSPIRRFWRKYRRWIVIGLIVYAVGTLLLILMTRGPQSEPFIYQVF
ncbi:MAG: hypothetical protein IT516_09525 [Burkholderiales bacterium]|nr:hypothetical protein [Burkholderiales bacterium]